MESICRRNFDDVMVVLCEPSAEMRAFLDEQKKHSVPEKAFMFALERFYYLHPDHDEAILAKISRNVGRRHSYVGFQRQLL